MPPASVPPEAKQLRKGPLAAWTVRLKRLAERSSDPLVFDAFVELLVEPPYQSTGSQGAWLYVLRELLRAEYADRVSKLRPMEGRYVGLLGARTMGTWMDAQVTTVLAFAGKSCHLAQPLEPKSPLAECATEAQLMSELLARLGMERSDRVARELEDFLRRPRVRVRESNPTWLRFAAVVLRHGDNALHAALAGLGAGSEHHRWLIDRLGVTEGTPARARTSRMASRTAPSEGDALLDAVLEHPDDDAPREVYAAWLSDRGDPRGEFIALQLAATKRALTAAEMRREASLLKNHAREWLGPIAPLVRHAQTRFTRGFPSHLTVYAPEASLLRTLTGNAIWATVEAVEFAHHVTTCSPKLSVQDGIVHPVFRSLRSVSGLEAKNVVEVCEAHRNRLEAVGIYGPADAKRRPGAIDAEEGKAIDALESLPLLKRVRVGGDRLASDSYCEDLRSRLRALVASRALDLFSVYGGYRNAELWLSDLEATGATIGCLEFRSDTCGVWAHEGLTIRTSISAGRLDECIRMIAMPRRTKDPAHRLALAMSSVVHHVLTFQAAGARRFEIVVPHGYDGQRTIDDTVASWAHRPALPELQFIEE